MWQIVVRAALAGGALLLLGACAVDRHSALPEFMKAQASMARPPEQPPDVKQIVHKKLDAIFVVTSLPRDVRVSPPHRDPRGEGWIACVRAELNSATGSALGIQTYRLTIEEGAIVDRRRVGAEDNCASERYEPVQR
jgi:hypothetical protein